MVLTNRLPDLYIAQPIVVWVPMVFYILADAYGIIGRVCVLYFTKYHTVYPIDVFASICFCISFSTLLGIYVNMSFLYNSVKHMNSSTCCRFNTSI